MYNRKGEFALGQILAEPLVLGVLVLHQHRQRLKPAGTLTWVDWRFI